MISRDSVDSASNALKRAGKNTVSAAEVIDCNPTVISLYRTPQSALNLAAAEYKKAVEAVLSLLTSVDDQIGDDL